MYIDVACEYHTDNMRDSIGGIACIADYKDMSKKLLSLVESQKSLPFDIKYEYSKEFSKLEELC